MNVAEEILLGQRDFELDVLLRAIQKRKDMIAQARAASLKVGDRIVLQGLGMGSKYLNGATGTVTGFATKNIKVLLDPEVDTRRYSHSMRVPPSLLRKMSPAEDPRQTLPLYDDEDDDA